MNFETEVCRFVNAHGLVNDEDYFYRMEETMKRSKTFFAQHPEHTDDTLEWIRVCTFDNFGRAEIRWNLFDRMLCIYARLVHVIVEMIIHRGSPDGLQMNFTAMKMVRDRVRAESLLRHMEPFFRAPERTQVPVDGFDELSLEDSCPPASSAGKRKCCAERWTEKKIKY